MLERKIESLYRTRDYFHKEAANGNLGLRMTDKAIINAETRLRDLR
jgi:hypothetical protein